MGDPVLAWEYPTVLAREGVGCPVLAGGGGRGRVPSGRTWDGTSDRIMGYFPPVDREIPVKT